VWVVIILRPLMAVRREYYAIARLAGRPSATAAASSEDGPFASLTREAMLQACLEPCADWLSYCEKRLLMDSVRCVVDVCTWKRFFYDKTESWRRAKALGIYSAYVKEEAVLEVNIDADLRDSVTRRVAAVKSGAAGGGEPASIDMFDALLDEVLTVVFLDGWRAFVVDNAGKRSASSGTTPAESKIINVAQFMPNLGPKRAATKRAVAGDSGAGPSL